MKISLKKPLYLASAALILMGVGTGISQINVNAQRTKTVRYYLNSENRRIHYENRINQILRSKLSQSRKFSLVTKLMIKAFPVNPQPSVSVKKVRPESKRVRRLHHTRRYKKLVAKITSQQKSWRRHHPKLSKSSWIASPASIAEDDLLHPAPTKAQIKRNPQYIAMKIIDHSKKDQKIERKYDSNIKKMMIMREKSQKHAKPINKDNMRKFHNN